MPIVLDETFAYFDSNRLKSVLEFLNANYGDKQIIILTCTKRETHILDEMNLKYNKVVLD